MFSSKGLPLPLVHSSASVSQCRTHKAETSRSLQKPRDHSRNPATSPGQTTTKRAGHGTLALLFPSTISSVAGALSTEYAPSSWPDHHPRAPLAPRRIYTALNVLARRPQPVSSQQPLSARGDATVGCCTPAESRQARSRETGVPKRKVARRARGPDATMSFASLQRRRGRRGTCRFIKVFWS